MLLLEVKELNGIPKGADGLNDTDYQKFNKSLCQFMDSMELAMYNV